MKHYLIAFSLVFSVLTSSWSGADVVVQTPDLQACHQMEMASHDCCDGECHCELSVSHVSVALLQITNSYPRVSIYSLVISTNSQLPVEPFQRKFLPPKI